MIHSFCCKKHVQFVLRREIAEYAVLTMPECERRLPPHVKSKHLLSRHSNLLPENMITKPIVHYTQVEDMETSRISPYLLYNV